MGQFSDVITFSRGSPAYGFDAFNVLQSFPSNGPNLNFINAAMGFTIEGSSQNIALRSLEIVNSAVWALSGGPVVTASALIAPDNTMTGNIVTDTITAALTFIRQTITIANDASLYACSAFFKKTVGSQTSFPAIRTRYSGGTLLAPIAALDTTFGLSVTNSAFPTQVEDCGAWWRFTAITQNNSTGNTALQFDIIPSLTGSLSAVSDITAMGSCGVWGAQAEKLPFRTSYIPTSNAAVARAPDNASFNASSYTGGTNLNAFSVFASVYIPAMYGVSSSFPIWSCDNAQTTQQVLVYATGSGTIKQKSISGGVSQYDAVITAGLTFPCEAILATRVQSGVMSTSLNHGALVVSSGTVVTSLSTFREGTNIAGDRFFGVRRVLHFTQQLKDDTTLMAWTI